MTQQYIQQQITHILAKMGIAEKAITLNASFIKDIGLDSLDFAEMVLEFETVFNMDIPILEIEKVDTVHQAVMYIKGKEICGQR